MIVYIMTQRIGDVWGERKHPLGSLHFDVDENDKSRGWVYVQAGKELESGDNCVLANGEMAVLPTEETLSLPVVIPFAKSPAGGCFGWAQFMGPFEESKVDGSDIKIAAGDDLTPQAGSHKLMRSDDLRRLGNTVSKEAINADTIGRIHLRGFLGAGGLAS